LGNGRRTSNFKTPLYSACGDKNSGQAKHEIRDAVYYCLRFLEKCKHITVRVSGSTAPLSQVMRSEAAKMILNN
jgi:hypothetical protein